MHHFRGMQYIMYRIQNAQSLLQQILMTLKKPEWSFLSKIFDKEIQAYISKIKRHLQIKPYE